MKKRFLVLSFFAMIVAFAAGSAVVAAPVLENGSFEIPPLSGTAHQAQPSGAVWTFGSPRTGIDRGNPYGSPPNCTPLTGAQMAYLQGDSGAGNGVSYVEQQLTGLVAGLTYSVGYNAKAISGFSGVNPFKVSIDGVDAVADWISPSTAFEAGTIEFTAAADTATLRFYDAGNVAGGKVTWLDDITMNIVIPETGTNLVVNSSFEQTQYVPGSHNAKVDGDGWRFTRSPVSATAGSGIDNNCKYGAIANATPYDGNQWGFIQGAGDAETVMSIEQDVLGFEPGKQYVVTFEAKAIGGFDGSNPFQVSLGEIDLGFGGDAVVDPGLDWGFYSSQVITASDDTMTLRFYDAGGVPFTQVSWIDAVSVVEVPEPGCFVLILAGLVGLLLRRR